MISVRGMTLTGAAAVIVFASVLWGEEPQMTREDAGKMQIIDANVIATHAYQVLLARKSGKNLDKDCWSDAGLSGEQLQTLVDRQKTVLSTPAEEMNAWVLGRGSRFDPAKDLQPILDSKLRASAERLPVNVFIAWLKGRAPKATPLQVKAVASLLQMMLDVDRDGDVLQDMYRLVHALGLPVHQGELGIAAADDKELLSIGNELSPKMCACPFDTAPAALQMTGRKMVNWGRRHTGERDKTVLARELMAEEDVKGILPLVRKMPAQKIAVIGHSYTMDVHWSSPSAFVPVVSEIFKAVNPRVEVRQWQAGGLTASRAYAREKFHDEAVAWKPDRVLLVLAGSGKEDEDAMREMVAGFHKAGAEVMMFDRLWPPAAKSAQPPKPVGAPPAPAGIHVIEVGRILWESPDRDKFVALDDIHMTEPWHRLMAKEWLKYLVGARKEKLEQK
jgi:hypothetical protein